MRPASPAPASNPSRWAVRLPLVGAALLGALIAAYLAAFQLGWRATIWDPVFGSAAQRVLTAFGGFPDAAVGAVAYLTEAGLGLLGGPCRWQRHPWLVLAYVLVAVGLAAVGIGLVLLMAVWLDAGCLLCLASAGLSLGLAGAVLAEGRAALRTLGWQGESCGSSSSSA